MKDMTHRCQRNYVHPEATTRTFARKIVIVFPPTNDVIGPELSISDADTLWSEVDIGMITVVVRRTQRAFDI